MAEIRDAKTTLILANSSESPSKVNSDINNATVKPIPARNPIEIILFQLKPIGNLPLNNFIAIKLPTSIPRGCPITRPRIIPIERSLPITEFRLNCDKSIPSDENENSGKTINTVIGLILFSSLFANVVNSTTFIVC